MRHCRVSLVPCRKDSHGAASSRGSSRGARRWRIWKTSSGATPTAMLSVKVGSVGHRGRRAWEAFCGPSPTAVRFRVSERPAAAGEWWSFLLSCLSAPCTPGGASLPWRAEIQGQKQCACLSGSWCPWSMRCLGACEVKGARGKGGGAGEPAQLGRNLGVRPCPLLHRLAHSKGCV